MTKGCEENSHRNVRPFKTVAGRWFNNRTIVGPHTHMGKAMPHVSYFSSSSVTLSSHNLEITAKTDRHSRCECRPFQSARWN